MAIQYKKIIKEIMGSGAQNHGFKIGKNGPSGISKKNLAVYEKNIDELYTQRIIIEYDFFAGILTLWAGKIREEFKYTIEDEKEFRQIITEFALVMQKKGYKSLEEIENEPRFHLSEHGFVLKNYMKLSEQFVMDNNIDSNMNIHDELDLIIKSVNKLRGKKFDEVKEELQKIAAYYTTTLLKNKGTSIEEYKGYDYYVIVNGRNGVANSLQDILWLWKEGKKEPFIQNSLGVCCNNCDE